jgi:hypothetical protein
MTISRAQVGKFNLNKCGDGAPNNASSQTKNYEITHGLYSRVTERSYYSSLFLFFLEVRRKQQSIFSFGRSVRVSKPNCVRNILGPGILDLVIRMLRTSNSITFLGITNDHRSGIFFMYFLMVNAGSKKDLRVFSWAKRMGYCYFLFSHRSSPRKTCHWQARRRITSTLGERSTTKSCMLCSGRMNRS